MKWIKKWSYLLILIGTGVVYLSCVDNWQVYAKPISLAKEIYAGLLGDTSTDNSSDGENGEKEQEEQGQTSGDGQSPAEEASGAEEHTGEGQVSGAGEHTGEAELPEEGESTEEPPAESQMPEAEPLYTSVEDDYFADAVFIGDSRTVGMYEYGGLEEISTFYASTGLTVYKIFSSDIVQVPGQKKKITIEEALQKNSFHKIYLMIGINEMGTGTVETFAAKYQEVVGRLLELQPDAILYIQGIMKVTTERSNQGDYITNEGIEARNEAIAKLADNERIFYLDVNPVICDETGGIEEGYTFDGVHLKAQYIELWKDFLKTHVIQ